MYLYHYPDKTELKYFSTAIEKMSQKPKKNSPIEHRITSNNNLYLKFYI